MSEPKIRQSYWELSSFNQKKADFAIIGAGINGLSTAFFLKKQYPKAIVRIYERGSNPSGASVKNAGFACIGSVGELLADLQIQTADEVTAKVIARKEGLNLLRETLGDQNIEYNPCGGFELFQLKEEEDLCVEAIPRLNDIFKQTLVGKQLYRKTTFNGKPSILNRQEGSVDSGKMMRQLVLNCTNIGVDLQFNYPIKLENQNWCHANDQREVHAEQYIICTNAYTKELFTSQDNAAKGLIKPGRGYVLLTEELAELPWQGTFHMQQGYVYFRNIGNKLLIGGFRHVDEKTEETLEIAINEKIKKAVLDMMHEFLGIAKPVQIEQEWVGFMGFSASKKSIRQTIAPNSLLASGMNGMGVALGMKFGKETAHLY